MNRETRGEVETSRVEQGSGERGDVSCHADHLSRFQQRYEVKESTMLHDGSQVGRGRDQT
jgi:hypothetical protein